MSCPCGLSFEVVNNLKLVGPDGRCTAVDSNNNPCGKRLADHPHAIAPDARIRYITHATEGIRIPLWSSRPPLILFSSVSFFPSPSLRRRRNWWFYRQVSYFLKMLCKWIFDRFVGVFLWSLAWRDISTIERSKAHSNKSYTQKRLNYIQLETVLASHFKLIWRFSPCKSCLFGSGNQIMSEAVRGQTHSLIYNTSYATAVIAPLTMTNMSWDELIACERTIENLFAIC